MAFIEKILKVFWPGLAEAHWISVDTCGPDIGGQILQLRMKGDDIDPAPIILYGFSSFESLVRSEKTQSRLLVSPGVHYLHLPARWDEVESILNRSEGNQLYSEDLKTELMDSAFAGNALARMESVLAHNIGNFLGPEKLLYGAHLSEMINDEIFQEILDKIRNKQKTILESQKEYYLYRLSQVSYTPNSVEKIAVPKVARGKILYIDDHAHLGWAFAVAAALFGNYRCNSPEQKAKEFNLDIFVSSFEDGPSLCVINTEGISATENAYMEKAIAIVGDNTLVQSFSLILIDLRLRWKEDEKNENQELSGIKVLKKIRETNAVIPVVVLTASRKAKNMEKVLDLGADAYFIKESPQPGEKEKDIQDYYCRFVDVVEKALSKSYLAEAWRLVEVLESKTSKMYLNWKINNDMYEGIPDDFKIDWKQKIISPLKKGIGFMRKENTDFEKNTLWMNAIAEAIINFYHPNDTFKELNENYLKQDNKIQGIKKIYYSPIPSLFSGTNLLRNLRNLAAHGKHDKIVLEENDGKIAMYLGFRVLIGKDRSDAINLLVNLITKMFPQSEKPKIDLSAVKISATKKMKRAVTEKDNFYLTFLASMDAEERNKLLSPDLILVSEICKQYEIPLR